MNLFDTLNEALTDDVVSKIAKLTDEDSEKTRKAFNGIIYTFVAGLIRRTGSTMSLNMLYNQIQRGSQEGELVRNIPSYLGNKESFDSILKSGDALVSQVFPAFKGPLVSLMGFYAGIKKTSSTTYVTFIAAVLVDAVAKEMSVKKMDVQALSDFLCDHHEELFRILPADLGEKMIPQLGLQELLTPKFTSGKKNKNILKNITSASIGTNAEEKNNSEPVDNEKAESTTDAGGISNKVIMIVAALLVAVSAGVYWYMNVYIPQTQVKIETVETDTTAAITDTVGVAPVDSIGTAAKDSVANKIATPEEQLGSFLDEINKYAEDKSSESGKVFANSGIVFIKGSQALDSASDESIAAIVSIMKKYPKIKIQIQGHSDNAVGMDNKTMATKRAFTVKKKLMNKGISQKRIDAVGISGSGNNTDIKVVSK